MFHDIAFKHYHIPTKYKKHLFLFSSESNLHKFNTRMRTDVYIDENAQNVSWT